jgi:glucose-6-phosphate 1-dehydrogenase
MSIQPDEGIVLRFQAKHPAKDAPAPVEMQFNYRNTFATRRRTLMDVALGRNEE